MDDAHSVPGLSAVLAALELPEPSPELFARVYTPLASAIAERASAAQSCQVVGIAGAQGTGKSTLAVLLQVILRERHGLRVALVSLDDYYLPRAERALLARTVHPLLATRGVPGTHDVDALQSCLEQLRAAEADSRVELYTFSKAEDDRSHARSYEGACDVVLLEGWCVMARPQHERELVEPINDLERQHDVDGRFRAYVNAQLRGAYAALWRQLSVRVFLAAPDFTSVHAFRAEQEHKLATRAPGAAGLMTPEQLRHFIEHYQRISVHMLSSAPADADAVVWLDPQRGVRALELR